MQLHGYPFKALKPEGRLKLAKSSKARLRLSAWNIDCKHSDATFVDTQEMALLLKRAPAIAWTSRATGYSDSKRDELDFMSTLFWRRLDMEAYKADPRCPATSVGLSGGNTVYIGANETLSYVRSLASQS